jgi:maleate isomerase
MIGDVAAIGPDAIALFCTSLPAAPIVDALEKRYDLAIHDSVATSVYGALHAAGGSVGSIKGFGRMFVHAH